MQVDRRWHGRLGHTVAFPQGNEDEAEAKNRHQDVQNLPGGKPQHRCGIFPEDVNEDSQKCVQEKKNTGPHALRWLSLSGIHEDRDDQKILHCVI